jgi:hypothetical protein
MESIRTRKAIRTQSTQNNKTLQIACAVVFAAGVSGNAVAIGAGGDGVAKGEASQQAGQQGVGLEGGTSSPILAGPEIIIGAIRKIHGEEYTIEGDHGENVRIRVTPDTNKVCPSSDQANVSSGHEGNRERSEIPPTPYMEQQSRQKDRSQPSGRSDQQDLRQHAGAPPTGDLSHKKATMGSTDARANEDVARGSGFQIGQCAFKEGDQVRVEASDMGTATTIKQLVSSRSEQVDHSE